MSRDTLLIINTDASRARRTRARLKELASQNKVPYVLAKGPELRRIIEKTLQRKSINRLLIAGGDGSVSLAASLLYDMKRTDVVIGVIPIGTANYFARSLHLTHSKLKTAFANALGGQYEKRFLCQANGHVFLLGADIGVTSRMFREVTKDDKQRLGKMAYVRGVIRVLFRLKPFMVSIHTDQGVQTYATAEVLILNQHPNERLAITPHVHSRDSYFEIVTYGLGGSIFSSLLAFGLFVVTLGKNQRYIKRIKAQSAYIETNRQEPVALDGDSITKTPLKIKIVKTPLLFSYKTV